MIVSINYDLKKPGQNYDALYTAIKSCGTWWHYLELTWLVDTALSAAGVWERLAPHLDKNDYVLVIGVTRDYQGWLPKAAWDWVNARATSLAA